MKKTILAFLIGAIATAIALETRNSFTRVVAHPIAILPDGGRYDGDMANGFIEGQGQMSWPNKDFYQGEFKNGLFHGHGRFEGADGFMYEGDYFEGQATGSGRIEYSTGEIYQGEVSNSLAFGKGTLTTEELKYTGQFNNNLYHGQGILEYNSGDAYDGQFKKGKFHGTGSYTTKEGEVYSGQFVEGEFIGQGTYTHDKIHYEGAFNNWRFNGKGTYLDENGDKHIGTFEYGSLNGSGEQITSDGDHYTGEFKSGMYHGKGKLVKANGDIYEGSFKYGQYDGEGRLSYAKPVDGISQFSGKWDYGTLIESDQPGMLVNPEAITEIALYNQNSLLNELTTQLQHNDPNSVDMYFLGIAGDGTQGVFRRELTYIRDYFDSHLGTEGKSATLINSKKLIHSAPLATNTSIKKTLSEFADKMDEENDILFIYMTSHGSSDFEFSLNQTGIRLADLKAETLSDMLSAIPVRWKVIVISACYSGGFIPILKDDNTLIMTAAASDKRSFGCSDQADFTYFGEAFFKDALPRSADFVTAFDTAKALVATREKSRDYKQSNPQIHKPDAILRQLKLWRSNNK